MNKLCAENIQIRNLIKKLLKDRNRTYKDLAGVWGVSESSVKRILTQNDLELERLVQVARFFGLSLVQLFEKAQQEENLTEKLSIEQDRFIAANPLAAYIHLKLSLGFTLKEVEQQCGLSKAVVFREVRKLDQAGLLVLSENERTVIRVQVPVQWIKGGRMSHKFIKNFHRNIFEHFFEQVDPANFPNENSRPEVVEAFERYTSVEVFEEFKAELRLLVDKYKRKAAREMTIKHPQNLKPFSFLLYAGQYDSWKATMAPELQ